MQKPQPIFVQVISYLFILLFVYAAISKLLDFENFRVQLAQSPLLSAYAGFVSYSTIICETVIVLLLLVPKLRLIGLYASLGMMSAFTVYIYLILNYSDFVPCSCGGILEKMGWTEHLIFNIACVVFATISLVLAEIRKEKHTYKYIIAICTVMFSCSLMVMYLFYTSEYTIKKENTFIRRFLQHPLVEDKIIELDSENYYFAGIDKSTIYLGSYSAPSILVNTDLAFSSVIKNPIKPDNISFTYHNLKLKVQAPDYYLYDGSVPIIYRGRLGNPYAKTISYNDAYFNQLEVIDSTKFALRIRDIKTNQYSLAILDTKKTPKLEIVNNVLEKQIDGIFDCDGKLLSNTSASEMIYMYSYRNQFLVLNQNLRLKEKLNTIDTTTIAKVKPVRLSNGINKMEAPPFKVNQSILTNVKF